MPERIRVMGGKAGQRADRRYLLLEVVDHVADRANDMSLVDASGVVSHEEPVVEALDTHGYDPRDLPRFRHHL